MVNIGEIFAQGGAVMWPLLVLSILSISIIVERLWFWVTVLRGEQKIVSRVLGAARNDWTLARELANQVSDRPIGRFLAAPLQLQEPEPEVFRLALESASDTEINSMRRGDKILEAVIALSPMLGLLGTVLGLIRSLGQIRLGDLGTSSTAGVTLGIGEALYTTATGLIVAVISLAFYRVFQVFLFAQIKIMRQAGNELELLYRQFWSRTRQNHNSSNLPENSRSPEETTREVDPWEQKGSNA